MQPAFDGDHYQRVLVVGSNHVGNNIFCTPALRFLKRIYPRLTLDVLATSRRGADAFRGNPDVGQVHMAFTRRGARRLAAGYDFVIAMYREIGAKCLRGLDVPQAIIAPDPTLHRAEQRLDMVRALTGRAVLAEDRWYTVAWDADDARDAQQRLGPRGAGEVRIGLHLGCGRTAVHGWKFWYPGRDRDPRLWSLGNYIALAAALRSQVPHVRLVITGSANEQFLARRFVAAVPGTVNLVGRTTIRSVAALMSELDLLVTQDTGILHVACATDVPIVALFGPSDPQITGPYPRQPYHTVLRKERMADISPDEVCAAARHALSDTGGPCPPVVPPPAAIAV